MAVRRLYAEQPAQFAFTPENAAWAKKIIAHYPEGKQASAIIPLLWRAQEQTGWLTEPAIRAVCDQLGMAYIRGLEVATFYTMFQLAPVGAKAHIQVCGTTPCMLRGSQGLVEVCKRRISPHQHELSSDGALSWEEVECLGSCANAPLVQIFKDTYEDLTPELLDRVIDGALSGNMSPAGSQIGRKASCPEGGPTTLTDAALYDGSTVGAWRSRYHALGIDVDGNGDAVKHDETPATPASGAGKTPAAADSPKSATGNDKTAPTPTSQSPANTKPAIHPAALTAMANAGLVKELEARGGGKPLSVDELDKMKADAARHAPQASKGVGTSGASVKPPLLNEPRGGKPDDLALIWGVAEKLADRLNAMGIWHFDQIAAWTPANVAWFEAQIDGFKGRVMRDKWIEQCQKLATGWRPDSDVGERPKD